MAPRTPRDGALDALTALGCVALTLAFAMPVIRSCHGQGPLRVCEWVLSRNGSTDDWRYFAGVWEAARVALTTFHEFPSWNPYHCGGIVLYQDPQAPFPGPLFLLTYGWLPAVAAMKVWLIAHLLAGALGARRLVADEGASRPEQLLAAALTTACGFCAEHFGGGHLSFTPFLLFPWLLWSHRRSLRDPRWSVMTAALLALCVYEGATYPLPLMLVGLGLDTLLRAGDADDRAGLAASLPVLGALFPTLAAARLLPVLHYLKEHPRLVPLDDSMSLAEVLQTWVVREHPRAFEGHVFVWPEYGCYVGWVPVLLGLAGLASAVARRDARRRARLLDAAILGGLVWCALGNIPGLSLFGLLHELPIYKSLRVPSRFLYPATVMLAVIAVRGLADLRATMTAARVRRGIVWAFLACELAVATCVVADLADAGSTKLQWAPDPELPRGPGGAHFYQDPTTDYARWPTHPVRGVGTSACYVPLEWGPAPGLWSGDTPQQRLDPVDAGTAAQTAWTANSVTFAVNLARPATLVVNQNYETSWTASVGTVAPVEGLLAVRLPAGRRAVTVRHRAKGLGAGLVVSALGLIAAVLAAFGLTPSRVARLRARLRSALTEG